MNRKTLEYYLNLGYGVVLEPDENCWFAEIPDLPGCMTQGNTREEALRLIEDARRGWIKTAFKRGIHIPEPGEKARACKLQYRLEQQSIVRGKPISAYALAA